ncbi:MAG: PKD domain-containing protein [Bacteroidia bacterium]
MKTNLLTFIILLLSITAHSQSTSILFVGNSYTGRNNLPKMTQDVALSTGDTITYQAHTPGGNRLLQHAANPTVHGLIRSKSWDYVVLQAQSQEPSFSLSQVQQEVFPAAKELCDSIRANNACSTPLFYMTWGRKNGDSRNCPNLPYLCTYRGMDSALNLRYRIMADDNQAQVSPVGAVWNYIRTNHPAIELYTADESHPSVAGTYAGACSFYTMILQKDPSFITFDAGLDPTEASTIRAAAKAVVFDSLAKWNVGKFAPKAEFGAIQTGRSFGFINLSGNANSFSWDFGDSNTSNLLQPNHTYAQDGRYTVTLIATKCGKSDTFTQDVDYSTVSIPALEEEIISLSPIPNPFTDVVKIAGVARMEIREVRFIGLDGKVIMAETSYNKTIHTSSLPVGIYTIEVVLRDGKRSYMKGLKL